MSETKSSPSESPAVSAALQEHFVRGPVLTDTVSLGTVSEDHGTPPNNPRKKQPQQQKQQQQHQQGHKKKGKKGKNKNKKECPVDKAWCRAVHARLERFLASADAAVPFELLGPVTSRAQQEFAVALCRDVYRVPWRIVVLNRATFVSAARPHSERPAHGEVGLARPVAQLVRPDSSSPASSAGPHGRALLGRPATAAAVHRLEDAAVAATAPAETCTNTSSKSSGKEDVVVAADVAPLWEGDRENVGLQLLVRMGWTQGAGLGRAGQGAVEPLCAVARGDRRGVGAVPASASKSAHAPAPAHRKPGRERSGEREWQRERRQARDDKGGLR